MEEADSSTPHAVGLPVRFPWLAVPISIVTFGLLAVFAAWIGPAEELDFSDYMRAFRVTAPTALPGGLLLWVALFHNENRHSWILVALSVISFLPAAGVVVLAGLFIGW